MMEMVTVVMVILIKGQGPYYVMGHQHAVMMCHPSSDKLNSQPPAQIPGTFSVQYMLQKLANEVFSPSFTGTRPNQSRGNMTSWTTQGDMRKPQTTDCLTSPGFQCLVQISPCCTTCSSYLHQRPLLWWASCLVPQGGMDSAWWVAHTLSIQQSLFLKFGHQPHLPLLCSLHWCLCHQPPTEHTVSGSW